MRTLFTAMTIILTLGLGDAPAQSADEAAIRALVEELSLAVAKLDATAVAVYLAEDAVVALGTNVVVGRANVEKDRREAWADAEPSEHLWPRQVIHLLSPTTAIAYGSTAPTMPAAHQILTLVKEGNEWLVAAVQTAAPSPEQ